MPWQVQIWPKLVPCDVCTVSEWFHQRCFPYWLKIFSYLHETYNNCNVPYFIFKITFHKAYTNYVCCLTQTDNMLTNYVGLHYFPFLADVIFGLCCRQNSCLLLRNSTPSLAHDAIWFETFCWFMHLISANNATTC